MVNKWGVKGVSDNGTRGKINRINKRGGYKYSIILSLILGLMVLSLSMYFIFNEYFTSDDVGWEVCRQSIQIREMLPEYHEAWTTLTPVNFKKNFPLKCKTMVVDIEKEDIKNDNYKKI
ncbi:MAG: hypothetical protein OEL87_03680, partial [Nanoarchaeota archaeon]|nr:hypothetical protein [Nanoarchaeota archaeon]